jgi:hypothetical protein
MLKYTVKISHDCSYMFRSIWTIIREPMPNLAKVTILCSYSVKYVVKCSEMLVKSVSAIREQLYYVKLIVKYIVKSFSVLWQHAFLHSDKLRIRPLDMQIECKHIDLSDLPSCGVYCVPCSL